MISQQEARIKLRKQRFELVSLYIGSKKDVTVVCHCGRTFNAQYHHLADGHTKSCGCLYRKNLLNMSFSRWSVIGKSKNKHNQPVWICKCECGKVKYLLTNTLLTGVSKSCGCLRKELSTGENSKQWLGYKTLSGSFWCLIKASAKKRNLTFDITKEYIYHIFISQQEKCILSGVDISLIKPRTASLDRIDSRLGYIKGNIQWVHKDVNVMKQDMSDEEFIEWCRKIAKNNTNN